MSSKKNTLKKKEDAWWKSLQNEECPITLEPLSTLAYPPFVLSQGPSSSKSYFDGLALASYIVSRGIFQNPLTRQDLTWEDCRRLDEYLQEHNCWGSSATLNTPRGGLSVAEAFRLRDQIRVDGNNHTNNSNSNNVSEQQRTRAHNLRNTATAGKSTTPMDCMTAAHPHHSLSYFSLGRSVCVWK